MPKSYYYDSGSQQWEPLVAGLRGEPGVPDYDELNKKVTGLGVKAIWTGTQSEYDEIVPDPETLYIIKEA